MDIIPIQKKDKKSILNLYKIVTKHLRSNHNEQWDLFYPNVMVIRSDITNQNIYGIIDNHVVIGAVVLDESQSKKYEQIDWDDKNGTPVCIHRLAVRPDYQGRGIGKLLLEYVEQLAIQRGYTSIRLDVYSTNNEAVGLYTKYGYVNKGTIEYPLRKSPYYCMEKQLNNN
ncbi:GNAT family N-acetyltransferase [Gottfriedia acidiceleris]|uniref:GNAT family N-acetyltransferase n=1 Tax=Gottfriedia acidiceleris TaxID=371036 RepID=UPI003000D8D0